MLCNTPSQRPIFVFPCPAFLWYQPSHRIQSLDTWRYPLSHRWFVPLDTGHAVPVNCLRCDSVCHRPLQAVIPHMLRDVSSYRHAKPLLSDFLCYSLRRVVIWSVGFGNVKSIEYFLTLDMKSVFWPQCSEVVRVYTPYWLLWNQRTDVRSYGTLFTATPPSSPTCQHSVSGCRRKNADVAHLGLKTQCELVRHPK